MNRNDAAILDRLFRPVNGNGHATTTDPPAAGMAPALIRAADVEVKPILWLWTGKLALGKVNLLCGDPGVNKSTLTLDFASRVSTGTPWPDGTPCPLGSTLLVTAEDDAGDTVVPRLTAARADVGKVVFLDGIDVTDEKGDTRKRGFTLEHVAMMEAAIRGLGDCKLVVVDPVSAYLANADSHKNAEIRGLLAPLAKLAADTATCVLLVTHLNKGGGGKAMHRAMGSLAFVAAARSVWLVTKDSLVERRRLILPVKNNLGNDTDGMAFTVTGDDVPSIAWEHEPVRIKADEALAEPAEDRSTPGPEPESRRAAEQWLRELLAETPRSSSG